MAGKVIVIEGPTCSGKTALSLILADYLSTEIISADSRQVYRYLDIGTAKPERKYLNLIKHHFIDELNPDEEFNISIFETRSIEIINNLFAEGKTPVAAGGSGLYVKALTEGIFQDIDTDPDYRLSLKKILEAEGKDRLYEILKQTDPLAAGIIHPSSWKRVIRALEVFRLSGKSIVIHQEKYKRESDIEFIEFGLRWNRQTLYNNIEKRVDEMLERGLVKEMESILAMGYNPELNSLNTVGYKEIYSYLSGSINMDEAVRLIKRNTRRYAKRQMTWFNASEKIRWIDIDTPESIEKAANSIISLSSF